MNFSPVGVDSKGIPYMKFNKPFTIMEQIQLLQRSILVNSFAYYELNENILSDHQYDANALQLAGLRAQYPEEFRRSRYHDYFYDFCSDGVAYTSGFDLLERVRKKDAELYRFIRIDAHMALDMKRQRGVS
jgi:hypothetical protein